MGPYGARAYSRRERTTFVCGHDQQGSAAVDDTSDKLLDWALQALLKGDRTTAKSIYQQYADRIRPINKDMSQFYENLLADEVREGIDFEGFAETDDLSLIEVDHILANGLRTLKNGERKIFELVAIYVMRAYNDILRNKLEEIKVKNASVSCSDSELIADITGRLNFCASRLCDLSGREKK